MKKSTSKPDPELKTIEEVKRVERDDPALLKKRILDLQHEGEQLRRQIAGQKEFVHQVQAALVAAEPFPRKAIPPPSGKKRPVVPVLKLSDWHIGEVVDKAETEGLNVFDWAIAQERIMNIVTSFLKYVEANRSLYTIEDCVILAEGDWVSGDIHQELIATNEFPVTVQTAKAGLLLGEVVSMMAAHFKKIEVYCVGADNHGRLQKKPQAKQKSSNNYSYLVYEIAEQYTRRTRNIVWIRPTAAKVLVPVNGFKILSEHGDTVRGWSGHPYYGFDRRVGKEAVKRMNTNLGFHYWSIGHFHVPGLMEAGRVMINGSLSGTSEFDHLNGRHADPAQVAFMVHPKYGWFNFTAFGGSPKSLH